MKKTVWKHRKYGKRQYVGSYAYGFLSNPHSERVFLLTGKRKDGSEHFCVFESWEAAKRLGWAKA